MEEQKNKEVKEKTAEEQKYTYEQLADICNKLFQENQQLKHQIQQAEKFIQTINRLDYLFRVVEISNKDSRWQFSEDFTSSCIEEIQNLITIPEESDKETPEGN